MSKELREQIAKLLSDISGEIEPDDETKIINAAYQRLAFSKKKVSEESIIDAILAAFQEDEEEVYFEENPYDEELFDLLRVSSYSNDVIKGALNGFEREAANEADLHRGAIGSYYDTKGKDYRPADSKSKKGKMDEVEIKDGAHDDIPYHNDATKSTTVVRTKADMLTR